MIMTPEIHGMDNTQCEDNSKNYGISFATQQIGTEKKETEVAGTRNSTLTASYVDALVSNSKTEVKVDNNCIKKNEAVDKENPILIITDSEVGNSKSNIGPVQEKQIDGPDGVNPTKSKSTWTRIIRMDYGLGGIRATDIPLLGKRTSMQIDSLSKLQEEECTQTVKRGKVDGGKKKFDETSARVDYHPCRKQ